MSLAAAHQRLGVVQVPATRHPLPWPGRGEHRQPACPGWCGRMGGDDLGHHGRRLQLQAAAPRPLRRSQQLGFSDDDLQQEGAHLEAIGSRPGFQLDAQLLQPRP